MAEFEYQINCSQNNAFPFVPTPLSTGEGLGVRPKKAKGKKNVVATVVPFAKETAANNQSASENETVVENKGAAENKKAVENKGAAEEV